MRKKSTLVKISSVWCFLEVDKTSLLPTALKFDKNFTQNHFSLKNHIFAFLTKKPWYERHLSLKDR